jgi:hypothetical protein
MQEEYLGDSYDLIKRFFVSHAPFLFTAQDENMLGSLFARLISEGIPKERFEQSGILAKA